MTSIFLKSFMDLPGAAVFLSGSGTNAEALLKDVFDEKKTPSWRPEVLVTDRPETSRAREIAAAFGLPLVEHDIRRFYEERGLSRVTIATEEGMRVREEWTDVLIEKLKPYRISFGLLAGFVPLCNITKVFPCLNVHPGDLTVTEHGRRLFAGLHLLPTETAILRGCDSIRSSVILAQSVSAGGSEMDEGPVLGISDAMPLDLEGHTREELQRVQEERASKSPAERRTDLLARIAEHNVERLKKCGDWKLFPRVTRDFADGFFDWKGPCLRYRGKEVETVLYCADGTPVPRLCEKDSNGK